MTEELNENMLEDAMRTYYRKTSCIKYLDLKCAIEVLHAIDEPLDSLDTIVSDWYESVGGKEVLAQDDVAGIVFDYAFQQARTEIIDLIDLDICNDLSSFEVIGSYMCSSVDCDEEDKEELKQALIAKEITIEDLEPATVWLLSEIELELGVK